jgi:hypothetical protein
MKVNPEKMLAIRPPIFKTLTVRIHGTEGSEYVFPTLGSLEEKKNCSCCQVTGGLYEIPGKTDLKRMMKGKSGVIGVSGAVFHKAMMTVSRDSADPKTLNPKMVGRNIFVCGDIKNHYALVNCPKGCRIREDLVRIGPKKGSLILKSLMLPEWETTLKVRFDANVFSERDVMGLLERAGQSVGGGELRPEKGYACGMWAVDKSTATVTENKERAA